MDVEWGFALNFGTVIESQSNPAAASFSHIRDASHVTRYDTL